MALSTTITQSDTPLNPQAKSNYDTINPLLAALLLSVYGVQKSRKAIHNLKYKIAGALLKHKIASFFKKLDNLTNRQLLLILLGVVFLVLLIFEPLVALIIALIVLALILAKVIPFEFPKF